MAYDNTKNPFYTGNDRTAGNFGSYGAGNNQTGNFSVQQQVQNSQQRQLETQREALRSIYSSERMGVDTAEELVRQGEQLNRTENKLDDIANMQKESQKHITNLTSVFGGIKNWWNKGKNAPQPTKEYEPAGQDLRQAVSASSTAQSKHMPDAVDFGAPAHSRQQTRTQAPAPSGYDRAFNENLDEMSGGMSRLKQLSMGLGSELDRQNDQLGRITTKTDRVDTTMNKHNKDMRNILYGKDKK